MRRKSSFFSLPAGVLFCSISLPFFRSSSFSFIDLLLLIVGRREPTSTCSRGIVCVWLKYSHFLPPVQSVVLCFFVHPCLTFRSTPHEMYARTHPFSWYSEIGSLTSPDACKSGASSDVREPISLHQTVLAVYTVAFTRTPRVHNNKSMQLPFFLA